MLCGRFCGRLFGSSSKNLPLLQHLAFNASIYTLVVVALDRYRGIMFPLKGSYSKFWAKMAAGLIWAASFTLALPNLIVYHVSTQTFTKLEPFTRSTDSSTLFRMTCANINSLRYRKRGGLPTSSPAAVTNTSQKITISQKK